MRLREFGELRKGNVVLVHCLGKDDKGEPHCCGMIRIPFVPPLDGCGIAVAKAGLYWRRVSGDSVDTITLDTSINADKCGHFNITNGEIIVHRP